MFRSSPDYIDSYYAATDAPPAIAIAPSLQEDLDVDVCVVGAGFFGLYSAMELAKAGKRVAIVEASRVGWGASGRNGGQMIIGFPCGMQRLKGAMGQERAKRMFDASREAVADIRGIMARAPRSTATWCRATSRSPCCKRRVADLTGWIEECVNEWGYDKLQLVEKKDLPKYLNSPRFQAGIIDPEGCHIHPLKYVLGLARAVESLGVPIFEQSKADGYVEKGDRIEVQGRPARRALRPAGAGHQRLRRQARPEARVAHAARGHLHRRRPRRWARRWRAA